MTLCSSFVVLGVMLLAALYSASHGSAPWLFVVLVLAGLLDVLVLRFAVSLCAAAWRSRTPRAVGQRLQTRASS